VSGEPKHHRIKFIEEKVCNAIQGILADQVFQPVRGKSVVDSNSMSSIELDMPVPMRFADN